MLQRYLNSGARTTATTALESFQRRRSSKHQDEVQHHDIKAVPQDMCFEFECNRNHCQPQSKTVLAPSRLYGCITGWHEIFHDFTIYYPSKNGGRCCSEFRSLRLSSLQIWRVARTSPPSNSSRCLQTEGQKEHKGRCKCPMISMDLTISLVRPFQKVVELLNLSVYVNVLFGVWSHAILPEPCCLKLHSASEALQLSRPAVRRQHGMDNACFQNLPQSWIEKGATNIAMSLACKVLLTLA